MSCQSTPTSRHRECGQRPARPEIQFPGRLRRGLFRLSLALFLAAGTGAIAQPAPKLASMSAEWLQRGKTVDVVFEGENLSPPTRLVFGGEGSITGSVGVATGTDSRLEAPPGLFAGDSFN